MSGFYLFYLIFNYNLLKRIINIFGKTLDKSNFPINNYLP